ncbi:serine protease [Bosea sp. BIWAKO-01]|uniref:trypsin-like serine peptidase n=1 Tax=Bosea sp. BIWAKO-01 TaxID=506668 RepID=UPI000853D201|nr:serine protease [Bosea sp. BIWAKO-01]GAU82934.1 protease [Bosea sp. BIWAKO-01]
MKIDWNKQADPEAVRGSTELLRGGLPERAAPSPGLERLEASPSGRTEGATNGRSERERVERLEEAISSEAMDASKGDQETIKREVVAGARSALAKTFEDEAPENFTLGEQLGLEAVILTNGERPSLIVKDGFVDLQAPDIGDWDWALKRYKHDIQSVAASVGRIEVPVNPGFAGTCFVLAAGLVVTNRHVLEAIATEAGGSWTLNWPDSTTVDFLGEDGATSSARFRVTGVAFAGSDAIEYRINFAHLDMAVLRLEPTGETPFPKPLTFETDDSQPKKKRHIYVLGFPGKPRRWMFDGVPDAGFESAEVLSTIFNSKFGVKRLAPGEIKAGPGEVPGDTRHWICTHDASTLGGNSGSAMVNLTNDGLTVMGLHFGGSNRKQNWAHAVAKLQAQFLTISDCGRRSLLASATRCGGDDRHPSHQG